MKNFARPLSRLILISFTWGSLAVLVALAHANIAYSAEPICDRGDILLCEDWEDGNHNGWAWNEQKWSIWGYQIVNSGGFDSPNALKVTMLKGNCNTAYPDRRIAAQQGETHLRFYLYYEPGFVFVPKGSGGKIAYLRSLEGGNLKWRVQIGLRGKANHTKGWLHVDLRHLEKDGEPRENLFFFNNQGNDIDLESGKWYALELKVKPNTPGARDGEIKLWINGILQMHHKDINIRGNRTQPINDVWLTSYFGGNICPSHPEQSVWYDNIIASTNYIGPFPEITDTTPPNTPSGLRVE